MTLATIVLAGATVYATHDERRYATNNAGLAKSFDARASDWNDDSRVRAIEETHCCGTLCGYFRAAYTWPDCADRQDDDNCYRELYRAMIEAYESNASYHEIAAISPTGASFVTPTTVRPLGAATTY